MVINKLRGRMGEMDFTLTALEAATGISRKSLSRIVTGERRARHDNILKICSALKISDEDIRIYFPYYVPNSSTTREGGR